MRYEFRGGERAFAENVTIDQDKNIICGDRATASNDPDSDWPGSGIIVIGNGTVAKGYESTVIGDGANATGDYTTALGAEASAAQGSVAIGANADASLGKKSVAIGNSSIGTGQWSVAIGSVSEASGDSALALGYHSVASASKSVALGCETEAREENSTAIGYYSKAKGKNSMAIGYTSVAQEENTTAIGFKSEAHGKASTVIGSGAIVYGENSVAIGFGSYTDRENSVSVGHGAIEYDGPQYRQIINVADGTENNDAATYGQIIKKDTYTIQINDDGNGETTLATNAGNDGPTITIDASGLSNKITENTNKITAVDNKIGSLSADGTYIKKVNNVSTNLGALDTQVKANAGAITAVDNKIGTIASGTYVEAGKNVAENLGKLDTQVKANADAIGSLSADGTYIKKANNVSANLGALDTQVKTNTDAIGSLSADGKYIKKANNVSANLVELDNQVNANATAITNKANLDLSNISTAGKDVIINLAGNKAGEIVDVKLGNITSENYVKKADTVNANISALDKQLNMVDKKIGTMTDGNYISAGNTVAGNLSALDNQLKANADAINTKADKDLSNITDAGKNVIKDLAGNKAGEVVDAKLGDITSENYVKKADTVNANISALDKQVKTNADAINTKADKDLSNITDAGKNVIKDLAGNKAGEVVDAKLGDITSENYVKKADTVNANISALDKQVKTNADAINTKADKDLSNITDAGKNVIKDLAGNKAGEVVDAKLGDITSENYVKKADTVNANISALDKQVKTNADAINTKADKDLSNITDAGKNVIKDLAGNKAGEVVDAKLGDITSENYVKKADTVNANISALDKQMKANADNIGDTSKLTAAGLGSNLSDAVVNVNNKVGTADELKALKDAGLGDNLAQATAAVNKKADKNAADIKTVNGRVDELGGRVDTLGGAVSKLDTKVNKVGAGAAALAALHPMDFDPDNKLSFAAGVGSYHGASAVAIGAFYRPSEQVMFSISGNMGNGENMVNAGVSFALDRPSKTPTTKAALVKTVAAQNEQIAALKETVAEQKEIVAEQNEKIARLEAMVEKLAAKQST